MRRVPRRARLASSDSPPQSLWEDRIHARCHDRLAEGPFPAVAPADDEPGVFDTFDFSALPQLSKPKVLELARGEWIEHKYNCCLVGTQGTGKTHIAIALGLAACRQGLRVCFFTAADLVDQLEKAQKQYTLDKFLGQLERAQLLICDELGFVSYSRGGVELLFRVFGDRYERASMLVTSNLPFGEWGQIFQGERMTGALLDRFTHRCHIFEMNGESYRFRESMKSKKGRKSA